ncbi:ATPase, partial [Paenibacillus jamilae]
MNNKNKSNAAVRLPRAKGIDMATIYTPKECARKVKRIVLAEKNQTIVDEFITILGMKEKFEEQDVPMPNKIVMFGPPGTGKTLTAFYLAQRL